MMIHPTTNLRPQSLTEVAPTIKKSWAASWAVLRQDFSTTPSRIRSARNISIALCLVFFTFFMAYQSYLLHAFKTIGRDSAPSIIMAENMRQLLASANGNALRVGIQKDPAARAAAMTRVRASLDEARTRLVDASANITYGEEERIPLVALAKALGQYDQALGEAVASNFEYLSMVRADSIMRKEALPAASALDQANFAHLDKAFTEHGGHVMSFGAPALMVALGLLGYLLWAQMDLYRHTNRVLNKGYLVASMACVSFCAVAAWSTLTAESALRIAKKDAFDSVHALWMVKSVAHEARSARAAMILAAGKPAEFEARYQQYVGFARRISSLNAVDLRRALVEGRKFGGYLGEEFGNITFEGERESATEAAKEWVCYTDMNPASLIGLKASKLDMGAPEVLDVQGSPGCFESFEKGIDKTLEINQKVFDQEVDLAMGRIGLLPWWAFAMLALGVGGCYFGAKARLDEYRF